MSGIWNAGYSISHETKAEWDVTRIGGTAICTRRERLAVFQGGNGYVRSWKVALPFTFASIPAVNCTRVHGGGAFDDIKYSLYASSVTASSAEFRFVCTDGKLPEQIKSGFDIIVIGRLS